MSEFNVSIPAGEKRRLKTGGKYCPADVLVNAEMPAKVVEKDVNFHDYDGTLLYSYTLAEAQTLTELPPLPEHEGLICQGWNWTLSDVKALTRPMTIGAMYTTDDGATRLYLELPQNMTITPHFKQTVANGVTIDWGDGSATETVPGTGTVSKSHAYAEGGSYVISLKVTSGTLTPGWQMNNYNILGPYDYPYAPVYNSLVKAEIGDNVSVISQRAFFRCFSLKSISVSSRIEYVEASSIGDCVALQFFVSPINNLTVGNYALSNSLSLRGIALSNKVSRIGDGAFYWCRSLLRVDVPDNAAVSGVDTFRENHVLRSVNTKSGFAPNGSHVLRGCYALTECDIAEGTTEIGANAFYTCYSLRKLVFPSALTSIAAMAFADCYGMREYDFTQCAVVPTLANTNAFTNIHADCVIKVPAALYDEWIAATNWATYASKIVSA